MPGDLTMCDVRVCVHTLIYTKYSILIVHSENELRFGAKVCEITHNLMHSFSCRVCIAIWDDETAETQKKQEENTKMFISRTSHTRYTSFIDVDAFFGHCGHSKWFEME